MSVLAKNARANYDNAIEEKITAGLVLCGSEVKSIRNGRISIKGSYCNFRNGELWLIGATIPPYPNATVNHEEQADRKILVTKKQLKELVAKRQQGYVIVPISILTKRNFIKLIMGIGKPKKNYDKREVLRKKDDQKRKSQIIKQNRAL